MELPVCNSNYTYDCDVQRIFFVGQCYFCNVPGSPARPLKRCGGCQLVAYCSKECQMNHRSKHKPACKEFPVVNGVNSLHTTGSWKDHIAHLRK